MIYIYEFIIGWEVVVEEVEGWRVPV